MLDVLRCEQKYNINPAVMHYLLGKLNCTLNADSNNQNGGYIVRSLYFDTPFDSDYFDKVEGLEIRRKIRLRVYGVEDSVAKLELKEKQDSFQRKRSLILDRDDAKELIKGNYSVLLKYSEEFAAEIYGRMTQYSYRPKCVVQYYRTAFAEPVNDTRITFDRNLSASVADFDIFSPNINLYPVGLYGNCTMEVKFNRFLLSYVKNLVSLADKTPISCSKYEMARQMFLNE